MNALVDTNVLLDVALNRHPHAITACGVWTLAEERRVQGSVSALSFNNVDYVVRKIAGRAKALGILGNMLALFDVVPLDRAILEQSVHSGMADFEDAIQYFSALRAQARYIVTRDPGHFPKGELEVVSPGEFLALVSAGGKI